MSQCDRSEGCGGGGRGCRGCRGLRGVGEKETDGEAAANLTAHLGNDTLNNMNLRSAAAEREKKKKIKMFPRQGGNPAGVYDKYDLHNKARLWEKDHTARSAAGNTFSFMKNRGRAKHYRRGEGGGWRVCGRTN